MTASSLLPPRELGAHAVNQPSPRHFLSACGSDEPLRVGVGPRDELSSETWTFSQPFLVIGRRPESDLVLDHWQVSRRHAYLQLIGGRYYCVDLGSRTGTHGGDATERSGWLDRGRAIQIGPFVIRPEGPSAPPEEMKDFPGVTWELPGRSIGQAVWRMDRHLVLVGRSPACKVRIVEPDVSKFHCSLVLTPMGVWVVDLLGQKGAFVNDEPVRCARLEDGDELRIGRHTLRPRYDGALPDHGPSPALPPIPDLPGPSESGPATTGGELVAPPAPAWPASGRELSTFVERPDGLADPTVTTLIQQFGMMQRQMFDQFHNTMMMMFEGFAALHREQSGAFREEFEQVRKLSQEIEALRAETAKLAESARSPGRPISPAPANGHPAPAARRELPTRPFEPIKRPEAPSPGPEVDIHARLCSRLASIESERQNRWQKILGMMSSRS